MMSCCIAVYCTVSCRPSGAGYHLVMVTDDVMVCTVPCRPSGAGYHLVMVKGPRCDVSAVTAAVQGQVSGAVLESEVGAELSFLLPEEEAPQFAELFRVMEAESEKLGVASFGASATTMEEVFLK